LSLSLSLFLSFSFSFFLFSLSLSLSLCLFIFFSLSFFVLSLSLSLLVSFSLMSLTPRDKEWVHDESVFACQACTCEFTVTKRRHHCRTCGGIFCGNCVFRVAKKLVCSNCADDPGDGFGIFVVNAPPPEKYSKEHWVSDDSVTKCTYCSESFTVINRRHHCRRCGNIFCAECLISQNKHLVCFDCKKQGGVGPDGEARAMKSLWMHPEKEGELRKEGQVVKHWRARWFVLQKDMLFYFKEKPKEKSKPISSIPLKDAEVKCYQIPGVVGVFELQARSMGKYFYLQADTPAEAQAWVNAIQENVAALRTPF